MIRTIRLSDLFLLLAPVLGVLLLGSAFASEAKAAEGVDVGEYASVLKNFVNDEGRVNYKGLKANREELDKYLAGLARLDSSTYERWSENDKIAFWLNAYNALTLKAIINHYPIKSSFLASLRFPKNSIRQISGVWDKLQHTVMGRQLTLDDIEHKILRAEFKEPRIHMALVCASVGCPLLRREPYAGEKLDEQLDDQIRKFLQNPRKFQIGRSGGRVYLSPIFDWFGKDFVEKYSKAQGFSGHNEVERAVLNFISSYLDEKDREYLVSAGYDLDSLDYDWSLNEQ